MTLIELKSKLHELLGSMPVHINPNFSLEREQEHKTCIERRFIFRSTDNETVPCHLLVPKAVPKPCPVVICLQGHSKGMHISLGRPRFKDDLDSIAGGRDFALQAVQRGYAALTIEQRGMGERSGDPEYKPSCYLPAVRNLLHGRTILADRVFDVMRAIDMISIFSELDMDKIACMGNSGGGTTTFYAACLDERIKVAMPSCSFCTYESSIEAVYHCICNYIPKAKLYFEMSDLAALIVPRKLIIVAGKKDLIFPIDGVNKAYQTAYEIYKSKGFENNVTMVVGESGHQFYPDLAWPVFDRISGWRN